MSHFFHAKELRPGFTFIYKEQIYKVIENTFNKTGRAGAVIKCKVKNLRTGSITWEELTGAKLEQAEIINQKMQFLYIEKNDFVFMNKTTFETVFVNKERLVWEANFLVENLEVTMQFFKGELLEVELPDNVEVIIDKAEDAVSGDSVNSITKKAWLKNGFEVLVPAFIKSNNKIVISTITGKYRSR